MHILNLHCPVLVPNGVNFYGVINGASGVSLIDKAGLEQLPDGAILATCCLRHVSAG